jgi:PKHD-type hydroxylase
MFFLFSRAVHPDVCEQIIKDCKENILEKALLVDPEGHRKENPEVRKTLLHFIKDKDNKINELVWGFLREANKIQFNYDLTYFEPIQFAEYKDGGFIGWHQDDYGFNKGGRAVESPDELRKLTVVLVLSPPDTFKGGELQFFNGDHPMEDIGNLTGEQVANEINAQGSVICFDSRDYHRVTPVVEGTRYSLACWCVGPNFK